MADITGQYVSPYTSPTFTHYISYKQTARTGLNVTYSFTIESWMGSSSSTFGYSLGYSLSINGNNYTGTIKNASPTWTGTTHRYTTFSVTVPCGTGGGTLNASLSVTRPGGEGNSGKIDTGTQTVTVSAWNTAPYWSSATCTASPTGTIAENTTQLTVTWSGDYDTEGNTRYFRVKRYINGTYSATIADGITSRSVVDNIGSGNQGSQYSYSIDMHDGSLWATTTLWSNTVTKNKFTTASLSTSASVGFSTGSITLAYSGASNTNANKTFTYSLSCSNVTVYNPTSTPNTVTIYRTGTVPTGTYIKFSDIKSATSSKNYVGSFTFTLTTTNAYGSVGTSTCTVPVDLRVSPTTFSISGISGHYTINATNYYIPSRQNPVITWGASTDQLGGSITYDIQVKLGNGSFATKLQNLTTTSASVPVGSVSTSTSCVIRVVAKTSFGYTTQADSSTITLHYYNPPTISFNPIIRNLSDMTASGVININTSIPSVTLSTLTYKGKTSGSLSLTTSFSKQETGLTDTESYAFSITVQDKAGVVIGTSATTGSISVPKYVPILSIREKGVGVNAINNDNFNVLLVGGNTKIYNTANTTLLLEDSGNTTEGNEARIIFNSHDNQAVRIRYNRYDSTRAPFGIHIERSSEYNTASELKAYLEVEGDIVSGGSVRVENSAPTISMRNSSGGDASLIFDRDNNTNWRIRSNSGNLLFETDYTTSKVPYYEVVRLNYNSGDLTLKGKAYMATGSMIKGTGTGTANTSWFGFYESNGSTRHGYVGKGSSTNDQVSLRADVGDIVLQTVSNKSIYYNYGSGDKSIWHDGNCTTGGTDTSRWIKYQSGIMEVTMQVSFGTLAISNAWGSIFSSGMKSLPSYPVEFIATPTVAIFANNTSGSNFWVATGGGGTKATPPSVEFHRGTAGTPTGITVEVKATGRWK